MELAGNWASLDDLLSELEAIEEKDADEIVLSHETAYRLIAIAGNTRFSQISATRRARTLFLILSIFGVYVDKFQSLPHLLQAYFSPSIIGFSRILKSCEENPRYPELKEKYDLLLTRLHVFSQLTSLYLDTTSVPHRALIHLERGLIQTSLPPTVSLKENQSLRIYSSTTSSSVVLSSGLNIVRLPSLLINRIVFNQREKGRKEK